MAMEIRTEIAPEQDHGHASSRMEDTIETWSQQIQRNGNVAVTCARIYCRER
jgi:hypothetical protein